MAGEADVQTGVRGAQAVDGLSGAVDDVASIGAGGPFRAEDWPAVLPQRGRVPSPASHPISPRPSSRLNPHDAEQSPLSGPNVFAPRLTVPNAWGPVALWPVRLEEGGMGMRSVGVSRTCGPLGPSPVWS